VDSDRTKSRIARPATLFGHIWNFSFQEFYFISTFHNRLFTTIMGY
jgi:hypothetical protein